jgi:mono/diheme cytochrome c family protein
MTRNELILGAVALVVVLFSLTVSMVLPRRNPEFPGRHLGLFVVVCVALVIAMLTAVELFGAEEGHGASEEQNAATEVQDSGEPDAEEGSETGGETEGGETGETAGGDAAAGEEVFASAGCANCHVLEAAGAEGSVGPNLDELQPSAEATAEQVTNGGNGMPAYGDQLSPEEIADVAAFVAESAG